MVEKEGKKVKKIIPLLVMVVLLLSAFVVSASATTIPTVDKPFTYVDSEPTAAEIRNQIQNIYQKARNSRGSSFSG